MGFSPFYKGNHKVKRALAQYFICFIHPQKPVVIDFMFWRKQEWALAHLLK